MTNPLISLAIFGTRLNQAGWEGLLLLNRPPFPLLLNLGVPGMGMNRTYYTIGIRETYTQFTLVYNPKYIQAYDANRDGALKLSISIPRGYRLAGGISPYKLLIELQTVLEKEALTPVPGVPGKYKFKEKFPSVEVFEEVLKNYPLEKFEGRHRPMSATAQSLGVILANDPTTELLFKDVHYPEFTEYKEIVVAQNSESAPTFPLLEIPRRIKYEIFDGVINITHQLPMYHYGYDDLITIDVLARLNKDRRAYENTELKFTINEVREGKNPFVKVDEANERIVVTIPKPAEKKKRINVRVTGVSPSNHVYNNLSIKWGGKEFPILPGNVIELRGEEITAYLTNKFDVKIKDPNKYTIDGGVWIIADDRLSIPIKEVPKPKPEQKSERKPIPYPNPMDSGSIIPVTLILEDPKDISNESREYRVRFKSKAKSFSLNCYFDQTNRGWETKFEIPEKWAGEYTLSIVTDTIKVRENKRCSLSKKKPEIIVKKDDTNKLRWLDNADNRLKVKIFAYVLGVFLIAFLSIWGYSKLQGLFRKHEPLQDESTGQTTEVDGAPKVKEYQALLKLYSDTLSQEGVTFAQIHNMEAWVDSLSPEAKIVPEIDAFSKKVKAYISVVKVIENSTTRKMGDIQKASLDAKDILDSINFVRLKAVWDKGPNSNGNSVLIGPKEEAKVNQKLKEGQFNSFLDLPDSRELKSDTTSTDVRNQDRNRTGRRR